MDPTLLSGLSTFSAPALLGLAVFLVLTGKIPSKGAYEDCKRERDAWKEAYMTEREARTAADAQVSQLMELAKTSTAVIQSLPKAVQAVEKNDAEPEPTAGG